MTETHRGALPRCLLASGLCSFPIDVSLPHPEKRLSSLTLLPFLVQYVSLTKAVHRAAGILYLLASNPDQLPLTYLSSQNGHDALSGETGAECGPRKVDSSGGR
jgi:hypothetical protein